MANPKAGGFKLSLGSAKGKPGFKAAVEKPAKRPRLDLGEEEPEDDNKKQEISGWDAAEGGAVELNGKKEEPKGPRIIPSLPNRNWRAEAMKKQAALAGVHPEQNGHTPEKTETPQLGYGLTVFGKKDRERASPEPMDTTKEGQQQDDGLTEDQRLEKRALEAIINGDAPDKTVIPLQTEDDSFHRDFNDAPDVPTLETYEATPIEGFGAALLRGMGWKDPEPDNNKSTTKLKEIKRRPALLGIGAKPESAVGIELGDWGKSKKKGAISYNPVALRNKTTGEIITEEELNSRLEAQKLIPEEKPPRSSKHDNDEDADRRREKRKDRKDRDRRDSDYDSERKREKDRRSDRRRDKDDEYSDRERRRDKKYRDDDYDDSDRKREKRRDRDRRDGSRDRDDYDRRDKGKDRERRYRSRSPDGDDRREKRKERDRRDRSRSWSRDEGDRRKRRREYEEDVGRDERKRRYRDEGYYRK
jgi:hypothetical protein